MSTVPEAADEPRPVHPGRAVLVRFAIAGVVIVLATAGAVATAGLLQVKDVVDTLHAYGHEAHFRPGTITRAQAGRPQTLLLVGSDRRYGAGRHDARSDTLMLVRLDPSQQATAVMSIPRDLRVDIPGHGVDKINAAYSDGGLDLTARTVEHTLSTPGHRLTINHAIGVNFQGFRDAVNEIGCVYVDVDRRYYHSNLGLPASEQYAQIDIGAGYQKLCGQDALNYVRFRHTDNDIVRSARQQAFLRDTKDQVNTGDLLAKLKPLVRIFAKATETDADLQSSSGLLRLAKLAIYSAGHPVREVHFPATFVTAPTLPDGTVTGLGDYVTATPAQMRRAVHRFMHARAPSSSSPAPSGHATHRHAGRRHGGHHRAAQPSGPDAYDLVDAASAGRALAVPALQAGHLHFPFYAPRWLTPGGSYDPASTDSPNPRLYTIPDRGGHRHQAYRLVMDQDTAIGQYYGVQGTTWRHPPILDDGGETRTIGGRTFRLLYDGQRLRVVAWITPRGVYWVSNTLSLELTNRQMLGIARSLTRIRR